MLAEAAVMRTYVADRRKQMATPKKKVEKTSRSARPAVWHWG